MSSQIQNIGGNGAFFANRQIFIQAISISNSGGALGTAQFYNGSLSSDPILMDTFIKANSNMVIELPYGLKLKDGITVVVSGSINTSVILGGKGGSFHRRATSGLIVNGVAKIQAINILSSIGSTCNVGIHDSLLSNNRVYKVKTELVTQNFFQKFYSPIKLGTGLFLEMDANTASVTVFLA